MEPIPETAALFEDFGQYYDIGLLEEIRRRAEAVRDLVPDLVGLSLAAVEDGVAFTLVATDADVAVLDAIQYAFGGPCVDAPRAEQVLEGELEDPDDEERWHTFARASSAKAVASTLTLPMLDGEKVVGSVNLYAASGGAFGGLHEEIADIFDAWAPGAITNADLSFRTRNTAERAGEILHATMQVEMAVGVLMAAESVDADTARHLLEQAAQRAGATLDEVADAVLEVFRSAEG
jgi:GAF domain-containing protein